MSVQRPARFLIGTPIVMNFETRPKLDDGTDGALTDADAFSAVVQPPTGDVVTYVATDNPNDPLVHTGTGTYQLKLTPDQPKTWVVRLVATGAVACAKEVDFFVDSSQIVR